MAVCRVAAVRLLKDGPRPVDEELAFEVELDVAEPLAEDVVFRCVYIQDASNQKGDDDAELESIDVGEGSGLPAGRMTVTLEAPAPTRSMIIQSGGPFDVGGMYISAAYKGSEFCRVGYYVRYEYDSPALREEPPEEVDWQRLQRVLSNPCATSFANRWDGLPAAPAVVGASEAPPGAGGGTTEDSMYSSSQMVRERSRSPGRGAFGGGFDAGGDPSGWARHAQPLDDDLAL